VIHLESLEMRVPVADGDPYPFTVQAVRQLGELRFDRPVTFFVGENGSGKSTLLEGIAAATHLPTVGAQHIDHDRTLRHARDLGKRLRLRWRHRTHHGFFLRAEDFFGFTKSLATQRVEFEQELARIEVEYADRSAHAKALARGPAASSLRDMTNRYGEDLDANSHGQSFLKLFQSRLVPDGVFLLDEPEAPLSPQSILALMAMIGEAVEQGAQFIIATHSPILLAFPGATIISFDDGAIRTVPFAELDHVNLTRDFLNDPSRYLRHLFTTANAEPLS
jgi:predicted ATPase